MARIPEEPVWPKTAKRIKKFSPLEKDINVDVVVIGGGITGLHCAYLLQKAGRKVAIIEKGEIGEGATEYTTAFITQEYDADLSELKSLYGTRDAKSVWQVGKWAISFMEHVVKKEKIECEFTKCSSFIYANSEDEMKSIAEEAKLIKRLGFPVKLVSQNKLNLKNFGSMEIKNQAKFHPLKYLFSLSSTLHKRGVQIFEKTEAKDIQVNSHGVSVVTNRSRINAKFAVIATYAPFSESLQFKLRKGMYTSYVIEAQIPKGSLPEAMYEDTQTPYHYLRVDKQEKYDRLIIGGEDHREELNIKNRSFKGLEKYLSSLLPDINYKIVRKWTGPILEPSDGLPLIGFMDRSKKVLVATAFSGTGMTFSAIAGCITTDLIVKGKNRYARLFDPRRLPTVKRLVVKGADYSKIFIGGAVKNSL